MEGDHAVEEQVVLPFGDDFGLASLGDEDRKLLQVSANEVPDSFLCTSFASKSFFKSPVRFVSGYD